MTVRHLFNNGLPITEALYEHQGQECCSRLIGHLSEAQVRATLDHWRSNDRRIFA
jgi:hypothetical protein